MAAKCLSVWAGWVVLTGIGLLGAGVRAAQPVTASPVPLSAEDATVVRDQMADWWGWWLQRNDTAGIQLKMQFQSEWNRQGEPSIKRDEDVISFTRREVAAEGRFLCAWKDKHTPPGNPKPLYICSPDASVAEQVSAAVAAERQAATERHAALAKRESDAAREREATFAAKVHEAPTEQLCQAWHDWHYASAREELVRRHAFTDAEWTLIDGNAVNIGMSEMALFCSMGGGTVHRTVTAAGIRKQYVFGSTYVYVENSKVVAIQD